MTIVAAWISAETGVGPAMASGSQTYSGICARLAARADEEQQADRRGDAGVRVPDCALAEREDLAVVGGAEGVEDQEDAEDEAEVADAVDDERLLAGVGGEVLVVVEADQQVRAEPDAFPADEHDHVVRPEDEEQHHEHEEVEVGEEARVARLRAPCSRWRRRGSGSRST